jgi:hypothetical protein
MYIDKMLYDYKPYMFGVKVTIFLCLIYDCFKRKSEIPMIIRMNIIIAALITISFSSKQ